MASPVRGLRPWDAARLATLKVPKPTRRTSCPPLRASVTAENTQSTAFVASLFERPASFITAAMRSFLFNSNAPRLLHCLERSNPETWNGAYRHRGRSVIPRERARQSRNRSFPQNFAVPGPTLRTTPPPTDHSFGRYGVTGNTQFRRADGSLSGLRRPRFLPRRLAPVRETMLPVPLFHPIRLA